MKQFQVAELRYSDHLTTLCLIVITTTCQTAIQFARGDDCCNCCQNTDNSYGCIMQSTREIIGFNYPVFKAGL